MAAIGHVIKNISEKVIVPWLQSFLNFRYRQNVWPNLTCDGGQVTVLLFQLQQVVELGWNINTHNHHLSKCRQ